MRAWWRRVIGISPQPEDYVSPACLRAIRIADGRQGWLDGPVWRSPKERRAIARAERRLHLVGSARRAQ